MMRSSFGEVSRMVVSAEFLGMLVLVASAAALGLSIVFDVGRVTSEKAREAVMQRQIEKKRAALKEWKAKSERKAADLAALQARVAEAQSRRQRALAEFKALESAKVEMVHELGDCDGAALGFWALLATTPEFPTLERRDIVFSRQIWDYRNCAHIWAGSADHAAALLKSAFPTKSGVRAARFLPLDQAPDGAAEEAGA